MKKKSFLMLLAMLLTASLALGLAACGDTGTEPELSLEITSAAATVEYGSPYQLAYTAEHADSVEVTVTVKDGEEQTPVETGYDAEAKTFTAAEIGEYTLTVTAVKGEEEKTDSVIVTVQDTAAPELTVDLTPLTADVNESLALPIATASDPVDGDLSDQIDVQVTKAFNGSLEKSEEDGVYYFTSRAAGSFLISYYVQDKNGNDAEEFLQVTVEALTAETTLTEEENRIDNLSQSGVTFVENFAKGYESDFAQGLSYGSNIPSVSIEGTTDMIAGNSLVFNYDGGTSTTNTRYFFSSMDSYIKTGRWTITMDVKVLSGSVPSSIYFSFIQDGSQQGDDVPFTLENEIGKVQTITYSDIKSFAEGTTWWFTMFFMGNASFDDFKIAVDNIRITWEEVVIATVDRTGTPKDLTIDDLTAEGGYTLTGADDNYTDLGGTGNPTYVQIDKLVDATLLTADEAANLTAENGFNSPYAIQIKSQINNFLSLTNVCNDPGYDYTLTVKYFAKNPGESWHLFMTNAGGAQTGANGVTFQAGAGTLTVTFLGNASYANIGFYSGAVGEIYIGDITVEAKVHQAAATTPNGYQVGQTWTLDYATTNPVGSAFTRVNTADVAELAGLEGFGASCVFLSQSGNLTAELFQNNNTYFEDGCKYEITFFLYVKTLSGGTLMARCDGDFPVLVNEGTTGYQKVTIERTGKWDWTSFYTSTATVEVYLGSVQIKLVEIL